MTLKPAHLIKLRRTAKRLDPRVAIRRSGFPFTAPSWPDSLDKPIEPSGLGVRYENEWARSYGVRFARAALLDGITRPAISALASPTTYGLDRVEQLDGPVVFAANHASHVDTSLVLSVLPEKVRHRIVVAAAADYFFDRRWKAGTFSFLLNAVPIERTKPNRRSAERVAELVQDGWNVLIFPEGGRSDDGWMQEFRGGAAYVSMKCGVPVVPVHIGGTRRILPKGTNRIRPSITRVTFGTPIIADEGEDARKLAARIERAVKVLADESATDWWNARKRSAAGTTPDLRGPSTDIASWRRAWALPARRRQPSQPETPWIGH